MLNALETPWVTLEVNDVLLSLCNDLGRPNLGMIQWSSFFFLFVCFFFYHLLSLFKDFLCGSAGKESACNVGVLGSIPEFGRSPGEGKGYPLQHSGLDNSIDSPWGHKDSDMTNCHFHRLLSPSRNVFNPSCECIYHE